MKKLFLPLLAAVAFFGAANEAKAQTPFKSALGIVFDGNGGSNVGIQYKTALNGPQALQLTADLGNNVISLGADWQYEQAIRGAEGLAWYAGVGAQLGIWTNDLIDDNVYLGLRPQIGLEYKIPTLPLGVHLDYKPYLGVVNSKGFTGDGFTFGVKYILK